MIRIRRLLGWQLIIVCAVLFGSGCANTQSRTVRIGTPTGDPNDSLRYVKIRATSGSADSENGARLLSRNEYESAIEAFDRAVQTNPDDHNSIYLAGLAHEALGEEAEARQRYDQAYQRGGRSKYRNAMDALDE